MKDVIRKLTRVPTHQRNPRAAWFLACAALLTAAPALHAQSANTAASIETVAEADHPSPQPADRAKPAPFSDKVEALRRELYALVRFDDAPRDVDEAGSRLIDLSGDALDAREAADDVETQRAFAEIELRARHALVLLAAESGQPIQTSIRSTQLRAAASRLADSESPTLSRLGRFYMTAAALGELQRDPSDAATRVEVAEDRLRRLRRADGGPDVDREETDEAAAMDAGQSGADAQAPEARAAQVALAVLRGNVGQRSEDNTLVEQTARLDAPASVQPALDRYRSRADLLAPAIRLREVIPPADPQATQGSQATGPPDASQASDSSQASDPSDPTETPAEQARGTDTESANPTSRSPDPASDTTSTTAPPPLITGPVTVVHYFQNARPASLTLLFALRNLRRAYDRELLDIVSVSLGPVVKWPKEADWPVLVSRGGSLGVDKLRVEVVPTFAVFDREGRLAIIGESSVVLQQVRAMLERGEDATP
jgi:hypothetical protein